MLLIVFLLHYTILYYSNLYGAESPCESEALRAGNSKPTCYMQRRTVQTFIATPKTTDSVRRSCACPETVPNLRCKVVERQRGEDGGHKWSVKQWNATCVFYTSIETKIRCLYTVSADDFFYLSRIQVSIKCDALFWFGEFYSVSSHC